MLAPRRLTLFVAVAVAIWGIPGATLAQSLPAVRIATSAAETYAQAFYAQDLGLYQKAGLSADVETLATGAAVSSAVAGGAVDVGVATTVNLANAIARGIPFVMIAPSAMTTPKNPTGYFESAAIVSRINKVDVNTIRGEVRPLYAEEIRLSEIQPQLDAGYKFGFLTRPVSATELLGH